MQGGNGKQQLAEVLCLMISSVLLRELGLSHPGCGDEFAGPNWGAAATSGGPPGRSVINSCLIFIQINANKILVRDVLSVTQFRKALFSYPATSIQLQMNDILRNCVMEMQSGMDIFG